MSGVRCGEGLIFLRNGSGFMGVWSSFVDKINDTRSCRFGVLRARPKGIVVQAMDMGRVLAMVGGEIERGLIMETGGIP